MNTSMIATKFMLIWYINIITTHFMNCLHDTLQSRQGIFDYNIIIKNTTNTKIGTFTTRIDSRAGNAFDCTGRPKPCLLQSAIVRAMSSEFWPRPACGMCGL